MSFWQSRKCGFPSLLRIRRIFVILSAEAGMTDREQRAAAKAFAEFWKGKGYEKGESQLFWTSLLRDVFGVEKPGSTMKN